MQGETREHPPRRCGAKRGLGEPAAAAQSHAQQSHQVERAKACGRPQRRQRGQERSQHARLRPCMPEREASPRLTIWSKRARRRVEITPQASATAIGRGVSAIHGRVPPHEPCSRQIERTKGGADRPERKEGRTQVVKESGDRRFARAHRPPRRWLRFEDHHGPTGPRKVSGRREAVGSGADHDRVGHRRHLPLHAGRWLGDVPVIQRSMRIPSSRTRSDGSPK
jgi:hypothetical protein